MVKIRRARLTDNQALIDLEKRSPLDMGRTLRFYDHGPDFFAQRRFHDHPRLLVVEENGELVALVSGAWHDARLGGKIHRLMCVHRQRVPPDRQRTGLGSALVGRMLAECRRWGVSGAYWFINPDNVRSMAYGHRNGRVASLATTAQVMSLDSPRAAAVSTAVRPVSLDEAGEAVRLINRTHGHEDLFWLYTGRSFRRRLARSPDYKWAEVMGLYRTGRLTAVIGLWDQGRSAAVTTLDRTTQASRTVRRLIAADYGFQSDREEDLAELIRHAAARAVSLDRGEVLITLPPRSPLPELLKEFKPDLSSLCFLLTAPASADAGADIWLDPIYL